MGVLCMPGCPSEYCPGHPAPMYCIAHAVQSTSAGIFHLESFHDRRRCVLSCLQDVQVHEYAESSTLQGLASGMNSAVMWCFYHGQRCMWS